MVKQLFEMEMIWNYTKKIRKLLKRAANFLLIWVAEDSVMVDSLFQQYYLHLTIDKGRCIVHEQQRKEIITYKYPDFFFHILLV